MEFKIKTMTIVHGGEKGYMLERVRACLVCVFKQLFLVFKQYFTYFNVLFHLHIFPQKFLNNNFQFLNTCTKQTLNDSSHVNKLGIVGLEFDGTFFWGKKKKKRTFGNKKSVLSFMWFPFLLFHLYSTPPRQASMLA